MGDKHFLISFKILTNGPFAIGKLAEGKAGRMVNVFMEIRSLVLIFDGYNSLILGQYWWERRERETKKKQNQ